MAENDKETHITARRDETNQSHLVMQSPAKKVAHHDQSSGNADLSEVTNKDELKLHGNKFGLCNQFVMGPHTENSRLKINSGSDNITVAAKDLAI